MSRLVETALLHHVAIQTGDLSNCVAWYESFLGLRESWSTETFSALTLRRLPGIVRLTELTAGDLRLHIFERSGVAATGLSPSAPQVQHLCLTVISAPALRDLRQRWIDLFESNSYRFARDDRPTEVQTDDDGRQYFYCYDVDGLELEFSYALEGDK